MKFPLLITTSLIASALSLSAAPKEQPEDLEGVIAQWVTTMREIQKEELDWLRDQEILQAQRDGLRAQITQLEIDLKDAKVRNQTATEKQEELATESESLEAAKKTLIDQVVLLENKFQPLIQLIPDVLSADSKVQAAIEAYTKTMADPKRAEGDGAPGRLQTVALLIRALETFQNTVTVRKGTATASNGKTYEMDVIYLGLAQAYMVNASGDFAMVGAPGAEGWSFAEDNSVAPQIRQLFVATTAGEAAFVPVPVSIK